MGNARPSAAGRSPSEAELYALIRQVRPLHRRLVRLVENGLAGTGITRPMRAVLEQLHDHGPLTVPQLARALMIRRQFTQRVVNELIASGLAERRRNAAHKRSWLIAPTAAGSATFARIRANEGARIREAARDLDAGEVETCMRVLTTLCAEAESMLADEAVDDGWRDRSPVARAAG